MNLSARPKSTKVQLVWTHNGSDSYNVYRGDLSSLVDTNTDGLPDNGYGACVNHLDPDLTDNVFVDEEVPLTGQGYFYLMARGDALDEGELGETSAGQQRVPDVPCPLGFR